MSRRSATPRRGGQNPLQGRTFWESSPPMGPPESRTAHAEKQEGRRKRVARRARTRHCLLKGCEQRFHPRQAHQRYCSQGCRKAARKWSRQKAQERYRETAAGQQKRNGQSRRYRERVKSRISAEPEEVSGAGRFASSGMLAWCGVAALSIRRGQNGSYLLR